MAFTEEFLTFFKELARNNHKEWFQANKKTYEKAVKEPFYALVASVIEGVKQDDSELQLEVKNAVFRINRDIRFSKDKTPYKLHVAAVVSRGGRKNLGHPGIYFHLGIEKSMIGGGLYQLDKEALYKVRTAITKQPDRVNALLNDPTFKETYSEIRGDKNKIIPKEFKPALASMPLVANKQFYFMADYEDETFLLQPNLSDIILQHYHAAKPWNEFLYEAIAK